MPTKRKYAKKRAVRKCRAKPRCKPNYSLATSNRPFPKIRFAKLVYRQEFQLNPVDDSPTYQIFRTASLYDPDYTHAGGTGGEHQPMGFDQLAALYNHYEVYGAKITFTVIPNNNNCYFGITLDDDATGTTNLTEMMEQRGTKWRIMPLTGTRALSITHTYSQKKTFGKSMRGDDSLRSLVTTSPTEGQYFMCWCAGVNSADPAAFNCIVRIEYFAKFSELKTLTQS